MFPFPSLPQHWEKRLVFYLLHRLNILEERTLGDLDNLEGSWGKNSVFTFRNVGIKVDRLRQLIKIPPRLVLQEAVVGCLTVKIPANAFYSGSAEILVTDVRISATVTASPPASPSPSPPGSPHEPDSDQEDEDPHEYPKTAEDLAQSLLETQTEGQREQLCSLYAENPLAASHASAASTGSDEEDPEVGVGTGIGLPNMLANYFKSMVDRLKVRIENVLLSLETVLPEERGGEKVRLELHLDDADVEGVSRNVAPLTAASEDDPERRPREGKRRITLRNVRGYIVSVDTILEEARPQTDSMVFGTSSEASTERAMEESKFVPRDDGTMDSSTSTIRDPSPTPPTSQHSPEEIADEIPDEIPDEVSDEMADMLTQSIYSETDRFADYDNDDSDEEVLAFAPTASSSRGAFRSGASSTAFPHNDSLHDEDEEEGGAIFASTFPRQSSLAHSQPRSLSPTSEHSSLTSPSNSPPHSLSESPKQSHFASLPQSPVEFPTQSPFHSPPQSPTQSPTQSPSHSMSASMHPPIPPPSRIDPYDTDSSDDMDPEASRMLSESTLFSHKEADSIYMSATSGLLRSEANHDGHTDELDHRDEEEVENNEVDERLDRLLSGHRPPLTTPEAAAADAPDPLKAPRLVKKECLALDRITIFFPSMSQAQETEEKDSEVHNKNEPHMPGAFSMYESMAPVKPAAKSSASPPTPQNKIKFFDEKTEPMGSVFGQSDAPTTGDVEMFVGNVKGTVDLLSEKILGYMLETVQKAIQAGKEAAKRKPFTRQQPGKKKTVQVISNEMDIKMIQRLPGVYVDTGDEIVGDDTVRIRCLLNDVNIYRKPQPDDSSTSKVEVRKLGLSDEEEGIITFVPPVPPSTKMSRRRASAGTPLARPECAITIVFSQKGPKSWINIKTLPIKLHFDLKRLEEAFSAFGGVGSVLASTTASTATITKARAPMPTSDVPQSTNSGSNIKVDAKLGGLIVDVVGTSGQIGLRTSPIKIKSGDSTGVKIDVDDISVMGPQREAPGSAEIRLRETSMVFATRPSHDDLTQMLSILAPSKDRFDDDDILVETLIRQREQGSLLRISVGMAEGHIRDLNVFDRFREIGDEVVKVLTVTDFVAGDERPGLLTLLDIDTIAADVQCGGGIGLIGAQMERTAITHVSAPALFACAVGRLGVHRNHVDELLGEGLERGVFPAADQDRPMLMVRMIGEELEPVVKIKLWNMKVEYDVQTLMAIMDAPENATGEDLAQEIVESIVQLPTMPPPKRDEDAAVLGIDVVVKDSILALNPLGLKSKGLIVLTDSRVQAALPSGGSLSAGMEIKKASVMVVDDTEHLLPAEPIGARGRDILSGHVASLDSMGYRLVITISSARAQLRVVETGPKREKAVDLDISDDLLVIESCADSTQTLLTIVNGLKPPLPETEEVKYCTEVMPVDMFQSMTEDAFIPQNRGKAKEIEPDDITDFIYDDIPQNLSFVESFYGHPEPGPSGFDRGTVSESMFEEDLTQITHMPPKRSGSWSKEQVEMLDDAELVFIENYFGARAQKRKGQRSLNEAAVNAAEYFPLRVRIRDVHVIWNLFDGYDWQRTRDTISHAVKKVETRAAERRSHRVSFDIDDDEESVVDDFLFNSIYIGVNTKGDPEDLAGKINKLHFDDEMSETSYATTTAESSRPMSSRSRTTSAEHSSSRRKNLHLNRSRHHKMQFELKGVNVDFLLFPPNVRDTQSSVDVRVRDLEIFDNVPTSTWRKFVTYMHDAGGREMGSSMVHIELMTVKPVPELAASELILKVSVLPLRLHVDQDTLDFLTRFFEFKDDTMAPPKTAAAEEPFLQRVEVNAVRVKLDYKPKKVDYVGLRSGHTTEFMNFFILDEADMVLRRVILHGISGFTRMSKVLNDTWMPDIKNTQLGDVLAGVAPVRSLVNLGVGVKDLVVVPVREYQKDGRVVRSIQKGATRFAKTTTSELVRLGAKMAVGTQTLLQGAEGMLQNEEDMGEEEDVEGKVVSLYADQPAGVVQGLRGASRSLKKNFSSAREAIRAVPSEAAEAGSAGGAARAVARAAPVAVLRPIIGATEAVSRTLMGVTNSLDPQQQRRVDDKYKKHR